MKRLSSLLFAAAAACIAAVSSHAYGQPSASAAVEAAAQPEMDPFEYVMAAHTVAEFARRERDPQALIVAARMLQQVPFKDSAPTGDQAADSGPAAFTAEGLLAEAKVLANGDPGLLMQINIAQSGSRGVVLSAFGAGLVRIVQVVGAKATYAFGIKAKGGELLRIGAIGDPKTRISMRLRDARGRVLCSDNPGDSAPVCSLRPSVAGDYRVEVLNQTATPTRAVIISN